MVDIITSIDIDNYLSKVSARALIWEVDRRTDEDMVEAFCEIKSEIIGYVDDEGLIDELEVRGFKVSKIQDDNDWYELTVRDWCDLANLVAAHEIKQALELIQRLSHGTINATCVLNLARIYTQTTEELPR